MSNAVNYELTWKERITELKEKKKRCWFVCHKQKTKKKNRLHGNEVLKNKQVYCG